MTYPRARLACSKCKHLAEGTMGPLQLPCRHVVCEDCYSGTSSRNPRDFDTIEGGTVCQALHVDSESVLDAYKIL